MFGWPLAADVVTFGFSEARMSSSAPHWAHS
jgi:hypothetical protein